MASGNLDRPAPRSPKDPFTMRMDQPVDRISKRNGAPKPMEMGDNAMPKRGPAATKMPDPNPTRGEMAAITLPPGDPDAGNKGPTSAAKVAKDSGISVKKEGK